METTSNTLPRDRDALVALLERVGDLKGELISFAQASFDPAMVFGPTMWEGDDLVADQAELIRAQDEFLFSHQLEDGRTVTELFMECNPDLAAQDVAILEEWSDARLAVLRVERREDLVMHVHSLVDEHDYQMVTTVYDASTLSRFEPGVSLFTRVLPLRGALVLSGAQKLFSPSEERLAYGMAARVAQRIPRLRFRNAEALAVAREMLREHYDIWMKAFGSTFIVGPPADIRKDLLLHMQRCNEAVVADNPELRAPDALALKPWPAPLTEAETVGVIWDPRVGEGLWPDFHLFVEALEDPKLVRDGPHREFATAFILESERPPYYFERLADERPDDVSALLRVLLDLSEFEWSQDGPTLLRGIYPRYDDEIMPSLLPLSDGQRDGLALLQSGGETRLMAKAPPRRRPGRSLAVVQGRGRGAKRRRKR